MVSMSALGAPFGSEGFWLLLPTARPLQGSRSGLLGVDMRQQAARAVLLRDLRVHTVCAACSARARPF